MKHILPILTAAFALTATTASAAYYYDDVYGTKNPTSGFDTITGEKQGNWSPSWQVDTVTYTNFQLSRISQQGGILKSNTPGVQPTTENFYLIRITGDNVKLSLTDYIDNIQDKEGGIGYNSNALVNMGVTEYGYRILDVDGNVISDTKIFEMPKLGDLTAADVIDSGTVNDHVVNRYKYDLGTETFKKDTVIELYMKGATEAYSYNSLTDTVAGVEGQKYDDQGGFADGYSVPGASTDKLMTLYYGLEEDEARKAMPLAGLDVGPGGERVYFGIYAETVAGSPLPGGLQIALVAGLFGLGFWYIRRRKAMAA